MLYVVTKNLQRSVSEIKIAHFLLRRLLPLHVVYNIYIYVYILSWKVFQRSVGEIKIDPFSFDTFYIHTYPGHRSEVRDIRASSWQ